MPRQLSNNKRFRFGLASRVIRQVTGVAGVNSRLDVTRGAVTPSAVPDRDLLSAALRA